MFVCSAPSLPPLSAFLACPFMLQSQSASPQPLPDPDPFLPALDPDPSLLAHMTNNTCCWPPLAPDPDIFHSHLHPAPESCLYFFFPDWNGYEMLLLFHPPPALNPMAAA
eukprot:11076539-Ditylum_brightwellii.AAC.1